MTDGYRRAISARKFYSTVKLETNISFILSIVQEHFALDNFDIRSGGSSHRLAIAYRHAIEEIEIILPQRLHHFLHAKQAGCHRATHVVIQPHGIGNIIDGFTDDSFDFTTAHIRTQRVFFQRLLAERSHR